MASSSTSSIHKSFKYDVFLSFRGEDTRTNFIDHLFYALQQKSIHTYKDDERIKKGKRISDEFIGSIEDSKFYIVVFSKNYASSSWCLDELVKIMECHKTNEHRAYPVFYDVEPSEIRKQIGAVGEAFSKHGKEKEEVSQKWKEALKEASDLAGWELKNTTDGREAKFIQKIVEELSLELRSINFSIDENLVGMETRIKNVVSSLRTGFDDVRIIGIKGIGGGGKTTLARAVYDQISFQFEGRSFVENVREVSEASLSGLTSLQKQVLSNVLNNQRINVSTVYDGKIMMKRMMPTKKVLVVLDDVDNINQLEALAGKPNWFKPGSVIIITTRDEQLLIAHGVKLIHNVSLLSDMEAVCLFSRHAFGREIPVPGYEELSGQVVRYAAGLPLTIRVLGSFLCGKNKLEWIDAVKRLKTIPLAETLKKLELSYIGLEEDYKEIFLNIACILKGRLKDLVIRVLESCGFHARNGLRVLEQKSLITIHISFHDGEHVSMHDHLEEMGMNIVRRVHPNDPNKHSRLWIRKEINYILANDLGTDATRYMIYKPAQEDLKIVTKGLQKMKELRFLDMDQVRSWPSTSRSVPFRWNWKFYNASRPYLPTSLRYLRWRYCPLRCLPKTFQAKNLVALEMANGTVVQLWKGGERKVLNKLRFLDLRRLELRTLDLGFAPNLETLNLIACDNLVKLHIPDRCPNLRYLYISSELKTLDLGLASNLETLILEHCYNLIDIHRPARYLNLRFLRLSNVKLRTLVIGAAPNLNKLIVELCDDLEELHMDDDCQKLVSVEISRSKLRILRLGVTPNLNKLIVKGCHDLKELDIDDECQKLVSVEISSSKLRIIRLGGTPNLEKLNLSYTRIRCLPHTICMLKHLKSLIIKFSILEKLPEELSILECLEDLTLWSPKIIGLPDSILMLKHLKSLTLKCSMLEKLPEDLGRLECLEKLFLLELSIKQLPDSICMLKHMNTLKLSNCLLLKKLPDDLGQLEGLRFLHLRGCERLQHIPDSICKIKYLEELDIELTSISSVPKSLLSLKGLTITGSREVLW